MTALPQPAEIRWEQSCALSTCRLYKQVQARTETGSPLVCSECGFRLNVVLILDATRQKPVREAKVCRFCRSNVAASDLGCCDACYERRHPDFDNDPDAWLNDRDAAWAARQYERDVS